MPNAPVELEDRYLVPTHLETQQSFGPFPARFILPLTYAGLFAGGPLGWAAWHATNGLVLPAVAAALVPPLAVSPLAAFWLDPPFEHGLLEAAGFVKRAYVPPAPPSKVGTIAVYRMPTINLETASAPLRRQARAQWGTILTGLTHRIKIIVRGRPIGTLPAVEDLRDDPREVARELGAWLERSLGQSGLIERDRLLVVPAADEVELHDRTVQLEKVLRQNRMAAQRIPTDELPLLRTLGWDPKATTARATPDVLEEGTAEVQADGWFTRAYDLGQLPPAILTNWLSPLLAGDEELDLAIDVAPQDPDEVKTWTLKPKINRLESSAPSMKRRVALEQLYALYEAIERRRVAPFEIGVTILVRGNSRNDVKQRSKAVVRQVKNLGGKLHLLRWEQAAGLRQLDPATTKPLWGRTHLIETGTLARTYPWSDGYMQIDGGVPWGEAGSRPCIFTPYVKANKGPHMGWYGMTNAGKGMGAHILWSRLHLIQNIRIFGIDQDEQHEHCGRFFEYLGGRKLAPRDAQDAADIVLHPDDGAVILDLSAIDERVAGDVFAEWAQVVKRHMLAHPGRSILFVDEATRVVQTEAGDFALRQMFERSRHWGQSGHVMTQRPSTWFGSAVGRAIQGNCDAWWCGAQQPRELDEVADALELTDEEKTYVRRAGIGMGLLVSGLRRVELDLYDKLSQREYDAFNSDPVLESVAAASVASKPVPIRKEVAV